MRRHPKGQGPLGSLLILLVIVGLLVFLAVQMGWMSFSSRTGSPDKVGVAVDVDKSKIREDAQRAKERTEEFAAAAKQEAHDLAARVTAGLASAPFTLEPMHVELALGARADVLARRSGTDLPALQLRITSEAGSGLIASGGEFKTGEKETHIFIEAPKGARSGTVSVDTGGKAQSITVTVKTEVSEVK